MHLPFRVRKLLHAAPATGLLLLSEDVAELLALCAGLGTGEGGWPPVHAVPGAFLVKLEGAAPQVVPGVVRLRCLAPDLYLPVDAELEPALLEDEAAGLARGRGLVLLPGG